MSADGRGESDSFRTSEKTFFRGGKSGFIVQKQGSLSAAMRV